MSSLQPPIDIFRLEPQYRDYVWGGQRLRPGVITAEAWAVFEGDRIIRGDRAVQGVKPPTGPLRGQTLAEAAEHYRAALLGERVMRQTGARFPLLIKLLDCAQWLSLQVHPNDEQAVALEGPGHFGKTEAWHILHADPQAEILCGFQPGARAETVMQSVRDGSIMNYTRHVPMHTGETVFIKPGTLHALGPGLLVYEVQQTSDITYRVYDWDRPASTGRKLHIEQSLAVLDPAAEAQPVAPPPFIDGARVELVACPYFTLELLTTERNAVTLDTQGQTFHILTVIEGQVEVLGPGGSSQFYGPLESAVVPAATTRYHVIPQARSRVLKASVE